MFFIDPEYNASVEIPDQPVAVEFFGKRFDSLNELIVSPEFQLSLDEEGTSINEWLYKARTRGYINEIFYED